MVPFAGDEVSLVSVDKHEYYRQLYIYFKVYTNEELSSNGRLYHKMCAKCKDCSRQLEFNTVYDGKDKVKIV